MSYNELTSYIADLRQSGFDTVSSPGPARQQARRPRDHPRHGHPCGPIRRSMGKRGGLIGIATAIGVAIAYWSIAAVFSELGNINTLPPSLAAWSPDLLFGITGAYLLLRTPT